MVKQIILFFPQNLNKLEKPDMNSVLHNHIYLTTNINLPKMFITELIRSNEWLVTFDTHYAEGEVLFKKSYELGGS